jgi:hypothetical protein
MSDQSSLNSTTSTADTAAPATAAPAKSWADLDIVDKLDDLNARLSALESKPADAGTFTETHLAALKRLAKTVFGDEL